MLEYLIMFSDDNVLMILLNVPVHVGETMSFDRPDDPPTLECLKKKIFKITRIHHNVSYSSNGRQRTRPTEVYVEEIQTN